MKISNEQFEMHKSLFDAMYAELIEQKKKNPDKIVNAFKVERIDRILNPIYEFMSDEPYVEYLELIPDPTEEQNGRVAIEKGLTYSDIALVLSQYKSALNQYDLKYYCDLLGNDWMK